VQLRFRSGNVRSTVDQIGWQYRWNLMLKRQLLQIEARRRADRRCFTHEDGQRISRHTSCCRSGGMSVLSWTVDFAHSNTSICETAPARFAPHESQHALVIRHNRVDNLDLFAQ